LKPFSLLKKGKDEKLKKKKEHDGADRNPNKIFFSFGKLHAQRPWSTGAVEEWSVDFKLSEF
jgi:hypothetical protein